jgi:hypothetical protein
LEVSTLLHGQAARTRPDPVLDGPVRLERVRLRLLDWRSDHRALSPGSREQVRLYIEAIIAHDPYLRSMTADEQQAVGLRLWQRFRRRYDALNHTEREDVIRAMGGI